MDHVQIPIPDFNFSDIAKERALEICEDELDLETVEFYFSNDDLRDTHQLKGRLRAYINELTSKEDKIVYLSVILKHLSDLVGEARKASSDKDLVYQVKAINKARYFFYGQAKSIGYDFDRNAFTDEEIDVLSPKIDVILDTLETLKAGQEVIFNHMDELKSDFESLKSDFPLGKKRWHQRAAGIVMSYAGEKGADAVFDAIKPHLKNLIKQTPKLIENIAKLIE